MMKKINWDLCHPKRLFVIGAFAVVALTACEDVSQPAEQKNAIVSPRVYVLDGDDKLLAKVNGSFISQYDLDDAISRQFTGYESLFAADSRDKVLDSLVMGRAMALKAEAELDSQEQAELDKTVQYYREQLLVKKYLSAHASPQPVTSKMVEDFYHNNPERFGARDIKQFELIKSANDLKEAERDRFYAAVKGIEKVDNWQERVKELQNKRVKAYFSSASTSTRQLHKDYYAIVATLNDKEISDIHLIDGIPHLFKVTKVSTVSPRALSDVRNDIRKSLAPIQLKKAIKSLGAEVLKDSEVKKL